MDILRNVHADSYQLGLEPDLALDLDPIPILVGTVLVIDLALGLEPDPDLVLDPTLVPIPTLTLSVSLCARLDCAFND